MSYKIVFRTSEYHCRKLFEALLVLLSFSLSGDAQTPDLNSVRLTTTILSQRDCRTDTGGHSVSLEVKLQLLNDTASAVEVPFPIGGIVIISRTLAAAKAGKHEFELNGGETLMPPPGSVSQMKYRQLSPGQSIESVSYVSLPPTKEGDEDQIKQEDTTFKSNLVRL